MNGIVGATADIAIRNVSRTKTSFNIDLQLGEMVPDDLKCLHRVLILLAFPF